MSGPLDGRVAVVTGASRGIGLAAAAALRDHGARVVITSRSQERAEEAATELGDGVVGFGAHATDEDAARACVEFTLATYGRFDVLVNNAGTNPAYGPVIDQDHARFAKTMDVNLWAPILWTSLAVKAWMGEHGGSVVNTASIGGFTVAQDVGVYHVSKAALIHLTKQLALELAPKVRVNAIAPGVVRTRLAEALWQENEARVAAATPLGRIGEPEDLGEAVAFLAGDGARWITGETLVVDGGQLLGSGPL
ncbi:MULTISPECIES: SDR family oxidoreductase [Streptomyces]|uniref:SDR family oxidoreductase n=1 Tax=Streptomyces TaxID=1883 RepID=UPI001E2E7395|nr:MULTISPECIES: SDR family oxidoreductase [Streptomyces]UFQ19690.1 SDR family oxidoreductase [Streptomyces huasconensis]WCL89309.1 SDR family oxidoreductase [Streptomyces sp. JCM 35825]